MPLTQAEREPNGLSCFDCGRDACEDVGKNVNGCSLWYPVEGDDLK